MQHYNPSIGEDLHRIFNLKGQSPSSEVSDEIVPVINIERDNTVLGSDSVGVTGDLTLYTAPSDKDTYITGYQASYFKNVACDIGSGALYITAVKNSLTRKIYYPATITLTAQNEGVTMQINPPLKIDRGSSIIFVGSFGAGALRRGATIFGYNVETIKGV